ncbi:hypothetical protein MauCBS54593_001852 [Microsporum audouinii]
MRATKITLKKGSGEFPAQNDEVKVEYKCYLKDNEKLMDYCKGKHLDLPSDLTFCIGDGTVLPGILIFTI